MKTTRHLALALAAMLACVVLRPAVASGSVIFASDEAASVALGASMALNDEVRQLQFNITGGSVARIESVTFTHQHGEF